MTEPNGESVEEQLKDTFMGYKLWNRGRGQYQYRKTFKEDRGKISFSVSAHGKVNYNGGEYTVEEFYDLIREKIEEGKRERGDWDRTFHRVNPPKRVGRFHRAPLYQLHERNNRSKVAIYRLDTRYDGYDIEMDVEKVAGDVNRYRILVREITQSLNGTNDHPALGIATEFGIPAERVSQALQTVGQVVSRYVGERMGWVEDHRDALEGALDGHRESDLLPGERGARAWLVGIGDLEIEYAGDGAEDPIRVGDKDAIHHPPEEMLTAPKIEGGNGWSAGMAQRINRLPTGRWFQARHNRAGVHTDEVVFEEGEVGAIITSSGDKRQIVIRVTAREELNFKYEVTFPGKDRPKSWYNAEEIGDMVERVNRYMERNVGIDGSSNLTRYDGIGEKTEERLNDAGYETDVDVFEALAKSKRSRETVADIVRGDPDDLLAQIEERWASQNNSYEARYSGDDGETPPAVEA